ncbi:hypothetical protein C8Q73DRAFT_190349 [Cubamyces lactineus]|nr:hypothetical protein C8Q73DRAFT_190349 [Cubamyces lactineus]
MTRARYILVASFVYPVTSWADSPSKPTSSCQSGCWPLAAMSSQPNNTCPYLSAASPETQWTACLHMLCDAPSAKTGATLQECILSSCAGTDGNELAIQFMVKKLCFTGECLPVSLCEYVRLNAVAHDLAKGPQLLKLAVANQEQVPVLHCQA